MSFRINGKIAGAIYSDIKVASGRSFITDEPVVEIALKTSSDSNSTSVYVLSRKAAKELSAHLSNATTFYNS